jgi:hypothetical protein
MFRRRTFDFSHSDLTDLHDDSVPQKVTLMTT